MTQPAKPEPPFKVGDRVRMKFAARSKRPRLKAFEGVVTKAQRLDGTSLRNGPYSGWAVWVMREGMSRTTEPYRFWHDDRDEPQWELVPLEDWASDTVARTLAQSVLAGDLQAALLLADRIMDLVGGTPRTGTSSPADG